VAPKIPDAIRRCLPRVVSPSIEGRTQKDVAVLIAKTDHRGDNCAANLKVLDLILKDHQKKVDAFNEAERLRVAKETKKK